ncbi:hypothetical protein, partial [Klebsiella aerogenes]
LALLLSCSLALLLSCSLAVTNPARVRTTINSRSISATTTVCICGIFSEPEPSIDSAYQFEIIKKLFYSLVL